MVIMSADLSQLEDPAFLPVTKLYLLNEAITIAKLHISVSSVHFWCGAQVSTCCVKLCFSSSSSSTTTKGKDSKYDKSNANRDVNARLNVIPQLASSPILTLVSKRYLVSSAM